MRKINVWTIIIHLILIVLAAVSLSPFFMMFFGGFKDNFELISMRPTILPKRGFDLFNYEELFKRYPYWRNIFNTAFISGARTLIALIFCPLAGFAFAKYRFPGRNFFFLALLSTMMIPFQSILVPRYLLIRSFNWLNTFYGLIIPGPVPAFAVFLVRQYVRGGVPDEILDTARVDGCSELMMYQKVALPMMSPILWIVGVLVLMQNWNNFLWPFIVIDTEEMFTIPLVVKAVISGGFMPEYGLGLAASALGTLPTVAIFVAVQKRFISSMMTGFMKG